MLKLSCSVIINIETNEIHQLTRGDEDFHSPIWSSDSKRLVISTVSGFLNVVDIESNSIFDLDNGMSPAWLADNETVVYSKIEGDEGFKIQHADIYTIHYNGTQKSRLTTIMGDYEISGRVSTDGQQLAYVSLKDGQLYTAPLSGDKSTGFILRTGLKTAFNSVDTWDNSMLDKFRENNDDPLPRTNRNIGGIPYIHQIYDTQDTFNGSCACNASTALMGICYYERLDHHNITVSYPNTHTSHFGWYVNNEYTAHSHTWDTYSCCGSICGRGGYGYYWEGSTSLDRWYNLRDYVRGHNLTSDLDTSETWTDLTNQIDNNYPLIVLMANDFTNGHYMLAKGYNNDRSILFNDPYGNMNGSNGWLAYDGESVTYDWPSYHNGYVNLTNLHNFITCQGSLNQPDLIVQYPQLVTYGPYTPGQRIKLACRVKNNGNASASSSQVGYYLGTSSTATTYYMDYDNVGSLSPGSYSNESEYMNLPSNISSGNYYIVFFADRNSDVSESDENNNTVSISITIHSSGSPDLIIQYPQLVTYGPYTPGQRIKLTCRVKNNGNASASASRVGYYLGTSPTATTYYMDYDSVGSLNPGSYSNVSEYMNLPTGIASGTYYLVFYADYQNSVAESNESNNKVSIPIAINNPGSWTTVYQTIQSPHDYPNNYDATWTVSKPGATKLKFYFYKVDTEANYDFVWMYGVRSNGSWDYQGRYHGLATNFWSMEIPYSQAKIRLTSDYSITDYGFKITKYAWYSASRGEWIEETDPVVEFEETPTAAVTMGLEENGNTTKGIKYALEQNSPNPFNLQTTIRFSLPKTERVMVDVFNTAGQLIKSLQDGELSTGQHELNWDGTNESGEKVNSGVYFYRIKAGDFFETKRMVLTR